MKRRPALAVALIVFMAALGFGLTQTPPKLPLPRAAAIHAALRSPLAARALAEGHWNSVTVSAVDSRLDRVSFFHGGQVVAEIAVRRDGRVIRADRFISRKVPYGDWIAYQPALLIGLGGLFVLMAAVAPWRRIRNLDVAAALSLLAPVLLLQRRYVDASVLAAVPGLAYLMVRCAVKGLGRQIAAAPSVPLLHGLTPGWDQRRRNRLLRLLLVALALAFVMVTVSTREAVDVVYAVMEGATKLIGGALPYGHMPGDVIHGDTYPLLSFVLYTPLAWVTPVHSTWASVDAALGLSAAAALAVGWVLFRAAAGRHVAKDVRRSPEAEGAGLRAALAWLSFPPLLVAASTGTTDVVLAALLAFALLLWRRPAIATGLLAAGAWFKLAPLALLPIRLAPLQGRRLGRALLAIAVVSMPMLVLLLALGGLAGPAAMIHAISFQFSRGSPQSLWSALGIQSLQPLGQAAALALVMGAAARLRTRPGWQDDRERMAALAGSVLIALQLAANYWAFLYLIWVVPPVALSLLAQPAIEESTAEAARSRLRVRGQDLAGTA